MYSAPKRKCPQNGTKIKLKNPSQEKYAKKFFTKIYISSPIDLSTKEKSAVRSAKQHQNPPLARKRTFKKWILGQNFRSKSAVCYLHDFFGVFPNQPFSLANTCFSWKNSSTFFWAEHPLYFGIKANGVFPFLARKRTFKKWLLRQKAPFVTYMIFSAPFFWIKVEVKAKIEV